MYCTVFPIVLGNKFISLGYLLIMMTMGKIHNTLHIKEFCQLMAQIVEKQTIMTTTVRKEILTSKKTLMKQTICQYFFRQICL